MTKKKLKCSIAIIGILILIITIAYLCMGKNTVTTNSIIKNKPLFTTTQTEVDDGSITYSTAGDDSANYVDGDTSGEKTSWVKNGDTWTYTFYVDDPNAEWYVYEDSATLMEGYTGDHTEYNADKLFTEETLNEFTPTEEMTITQNSNGNNVYTWLDSENSYKVIDNGDGTFKKVTTKLSLTVTNYEVSDDETDVTETIRYGDLIINKIVKNSEGTVLSDNEDGTNFVFTITLTADDNHKGLIEGTKVYGDTVFKDGVGTLSLKAGGSRTITGIPAGVSYSVVERNMDGYTKSCETSYYGVIKEDVQSVVTYVNTQKPRQTSIGPGGQVNSFVNVTLKKLVVGNSEIDQNYDFEFTLDNLRPDTTYSLSNGKSFTADSVGSANITVSLKHNETVTVQNIPVGSKYKVFEHAGDFVASYLITDANNVGSINTSANSNTKVNTSLATNTETADDGEDVTITFTNKKIITQNLKIQKTVTEEENANSYIFNIEFANMDEGTSFNTTVGKVVAGSNGRAELTIYLAGGESAEFYEVPVGTTYKITELASSSIASYTVVDENNGTNIVSSTGANTVAKKALSTEIETVNQGEDVIVTFTNDTVNQEPDSVSASLGVSKIVAELNGTVIEDCDEKFEFEITANDENHPMPENTLVKIKGNGDASFGKVTFDKTGTYTYKIVEKAGNNDIYAYDDTEYTIVYEVTNLEGLLEISKSIKKDGFNADNIIFINKIARADIKIQKIDEEGNPLKGAILHILDEQNNEIESWTTTDEKTHIVKLKPGTYKLHESVAPEGYEIAEDIVFIVNENGTVTINNEVVEEIIMKDPNIKEESNESNSGEDSKEDEKQDNDENIEDEQKGTSEDIKTGDYLIGYIVLFVIGVVGAIVVVNKKK